MLDINSLLNALASSFGVSPATIAMAIPLIILISNAITRAIPDTATGALGVLRTVTKFIGLHVKDNAGPAVS